MTVINKNWPLRVIRVHIRSFEVGYLVFPYRTEIDSRGLYDLPVYFTVFNYTCVIMCVSPF